MKKYIEFEIEKKHLDFIYENIGNGYNGYYSDPTKNTVDFMLKECDYKKISKLLKQKEIKFKKIRDFITFES